MSRACTGSWLSHDWARASCSQSAQDYLMSKASRNFRQDVAVSFHTLSSAPGATALLITGNKGNFIHIWLSPTFLGREGKKKWGKKTCTYPICICLFYTDFGPRVIESKLNDISFPISLLKGREGRSCNLPETELWEHIVGHQNVCSRIGLISKKTRTSTITPVSTCSQTWQGQPKPVQVGSEEVSLWSSMCKLRNRTAHRHPASLPFNSSQPCRPFPSTKGIQSTDVEGLNYTTYF